MGISPFRLLVEAETIRCVVGLCRWLSTGPSVRVLCPFLVPRMHAKQKRLQVGRSHIPSLLNPNSAPRARLLSLLPHTAQLLRPKSCHDCPTPGLATANRKHCQSHSSNAAAGCKWSQTLLLCVQAMRENTSITANFAGDVSTHTCRCVWLATVK